MNRLLLAGGFVVCLLASVLLGKPGTVYTKGNAKPFEGDVTEKDDDVIVSNGKIETSIKKSNVDRIDYYDSVEDQFNARLKKLDPKDVKGRIELAKWAYDAHEYKLARVALREAMDIDPNSREASDLNDTIGRQMQLESKSDSSSNSDEKPARGGATQPMGNGEKHLLKPSDINIVKQKELKASDGSVRMRFEHDVERRFANATNLDVAKFKNLKPIEKFLEIARQNEPKFLEDVTIVGDPPVVVEFKKDAQRTILAGCATSGCHGGPNAGKFMLVQPADNDAATYTNFYVLQTYRVQTKPAKGGKAQDSGGIFGGESAEKPMINRTHPDESILLNYALPAEVADFDHPEVPGYRGVFKTRADPRYKQIVNWARMLKPVDPEYGIDFAPPAGNATTHPTTAPTTKP